MCWDQGTHSLWHSRRCQCLSKHMGSWSTLDLPMSALFPPTRQKHHPAHRVAIFLRPASVTVQSSCAADWRSPESGVRKMTGCTHVSAKDRGWLGAVHLLEGEGRVGRVWSRNLRSNQPSVVEALVSGDGVLFPHPLGFHITTLIRTQCHHFGARVSLQKPEKLELTTYFEIKSGNATQLFCNGLDSVQELQANSEEHKTPAMLEARTMKEDSLASPHGRSGILTAGRSAVLSVCAPDWF